MDVVPSFVADAEASELMQPGNRTLHHPAEDAQPATMRRAPAGQHGQDAAVSQRRTVRLRIVGAVALDARRPLPGAAHLPADGRHGVDECDELGHIVPIGFRQPNGQGDAAPIRDEVVLAPQLPSIRRIRTRFFPPRRARMEEESTIARDQSSWSAAWSWASNTR